MSLRSLRAAAAVSSSASTTMRPPTMCSPPANRSVVATSALRQQGFVTVSRLNSSLTLAVIAIGPSCHWSATLEAAKGRWISTDHVSVCRGKSQGVVLAPALLVSHAGDHQLCPHVGGDPSKERLISNDVGVGQNDIQAKFGSGGGQDIEMEISREDN